MQREGDLKIFLCFFFRFVAVQQRSGVRVVISEKFVEIFGWYENDLDMVQQLYEKHKVCFYMFDNVCPLNVLQLTIKYYGKDIKKN